VHIALFTPLIQISCAYDSEKVMTNACFSLMFLLLSVSPVLLSSKHLEDDTAEVEKHGVSECEERVLRPMRWGLIPSWYHGDISSIEYKMNNARSDGMLVKTSFKRPLQSGRRCVVIADGYLMFAYLLKSSW